MYTFVCNTNKISKIHILTFPKLVEMDQTVQN